MRHTLFSKKQLTALVFLGAVFSLAWTQQVRLRVTANNASVYAAPEIGADVLAKLSLDTVISSDEKQGEWYRVSVDTGGIKISGFIHEMLVEVFQGGESTEGMERTEITQSIPEQSRVEASIMFLLDESRLLVREKKGYEKVLDDLSPLIAKVFRISDNLKQRELATEIYLWKGLAYTGKGEMTAALREFRNMFEVDEIIAKNLTRNLYDPQITSVIRQAEKEYRGIITEYSLEITTEPDKARIKVNGIDVGLSPQNYTTKTPELILNIEKDGHEPVEDRIYMTETSLKKNYVLKSLGIPVTVQSIPAGARIVLDGQDTGNLTNSEIPFVSFGSHTVALEKDNYVPFQEELVLDETDEKKVINAVLVARKYELLKDIGGADRRLFEEPVGVCVNGDGDLFVIDSSSRSVKKFSSEGQFLASWGLQKKELNGLKNPTGIAVDNQNNLFVCDGRKNTVYKFDGEGELLLKWGSQGSGPDEFLYPSSIALDDKDNVYVLDKGNSRVKKYSPEGTLLTVWGSRGREDGQFIIPTAVAVSPAGEICVLDQGRVQKFDGEGKFLASWGELGNEEGQLAGPKDFAIDANGFVYIADSGNNRIQKFDDQGRFIVAWGAEEDGEKRMIDPCGIVVGPDGRIYVADREAVRVQIFAIPLENN